ncbi:MAG: hypothetical protein NW241_11265 [Bacteroidia bacterium]|nr:hypothetical protein [Bacteroidia bacterium]
MVKNALSYQLLAELILRQDELPLAPLLKEQARKGDFADVEKLEEVLLNEVQNAPLQDPASVSYMLLVSRHAFQFFLARRDYDRFHQVLETMRHRLTYLRSAPGAVPVQVWEQYLDLLVASFRRLVRHISIEAFEVHLSGLDWSVFDRQYIGYLSTLIGYTYLHEGDADQRGKARIWIQKAIDEAEYEYNIGNYLLLGAYFMREGGSDLRARMDDLHQRVEKGIDGLAPAMLAHVFRSALFELAAGRIAGDIAGFEDALSRLEYSQDRVREIEQALAQGEKLPVFTRAAVSSAVADLYASMTSMTEDDLDQTASLRQALVFADQAVELAHSQRDSHGQMSYRLQRARITVQTDKMPTEKEIKEVIQHFKKHQDHPAYVEASQTFIHLLQRNESGEKIFDAIQDLIRSGSKKLEDGGFFLIVSGMRLANDVFLAETEHPGVSWMVKVLGEYFEKVRKVIDSVDDQIETLGRSMIDTFRSEFNRFEPASHFNIKVYFQYQLYSIRVMRLAALMNHDQLTVKLADQLLNELTHKNNPLSFIKADWDEFRKVPNFVRNNTINKCISITKGDLPAAADHLEFSYRNLRSYITFKEVNRLGFFLDEQQTSNRQLEQGIRYMFFDLYKSGTIFEVVFDMPKFLVKYSKNGFFSQDMERELSIKGTTAKKYLKIMMDIKLIRQDKTTGRKHYYRLIRENVMTRLGKDQNTLIK